MGPTDRLLQRALDGQLGPAENAGLRSMLAADPAAATAERTLADLDRLLRSEAAPRRQAEQQTALRARIMEGLPAVAPAQQVSLRLGDVVISCALVGMIVTTYGVMDLVLDRSLLLAVLAAISLLAGCGLLACAGALLGDLRLLGRLLHRRVVVGPGEVLACRAVGFALAVGGIWLTWG
jgi:anti-sigma factor RsiW